MKVRNLILAAIVVFGLAACETENNSLKGTVVYEIIQPNPVKSSTIYFDTHFNFEVQYSNTKGETVNELVTSLPWEKRVNVTAPFKAVFNVTAVLKNPTEKPNEFCMPFQPFGVKVISGNYEMWENQPMTGSSLGYEYQLEDFFNNIGAGISKANYTLDFTEANWEAKKRNSK